MRTSNPFFNQRAYRPAGDVIELDNTMTAQGAVTKTIILTLILGFFGCFAYVATALVPLLGVLGWLVGMIVGFAIAITLLFKREWSPFLAPVYAIAEGVFLGAVTAFFSRMYPGIAAPAIGLTVCILFFMLALYKTGLVRATQKFKLAVLAATGAIAVVYLFCFVLFLCGVESIAYSATPLGIGFSVVVVIIASLNLVLDFDLIETGEAQGFPKYMEWYCAFALLVTLVWLYLEILRLLSKLRR